MSTVRLDNLTWLEPCEVFWSVCKKIDNQYSRLNFSLFDIVIIGGGNDLSKPMIEERNWIGFEAQ